MRVVVVSRTYADPGQRGKLRALAGLGCTLAAAVPASWQAHPDDRKRDAAFGDDGGVRIYPVPVEGARWDRRSLTRLLSEFRPDLVQLEEEPWSPVASIIARAAGRYGFRLVTFSAQSIARPLPLLARFRRARTVRAASAAIGANHIAATLLAGGRPELQQAVIPQVGVLPPLTPRQDPQDPRAGFAIGFIGRLVPERGLDVLLRACVRLRGFWTLHVVGSGPSQEELEALAERLGLAARVTWHGALTHAALEPVWATLDCLVQPARTTPSWVEARGRTALEAMAHGIPVIGSRSGALPELLEGVGRVVPEDDVEALAAALQAWLDDPAERRRLGVESRRRVLADFTDESLAARTVKFWREVLVASA
ncbi:MAG TPA: glycosyltransferase [Gemmatimonadales bacterium]|nr:glycosyltransferase [Gemmatimonadales bacterium]